MYKACVIVLAALVATILMLMIAMAAGQAKAQGLDNMVIDIKNDVEALKAEIANTDLNSTGLVENLISKVYYYEGQVSVMGGGTWAYLHEV